AGRSQNSSLVIDSTALDLESEAGILMSTWLITGCSTGLGRALAEAVIGAGHNAVVSARNVAKVADLADIAPDRVLAVALDVTDPQQVASAAQQAEDRFGGVDVLVN